MLNPTIDNLQLPDESPGLLSRLGYLLSHGSSLSRRRRFALYLSLALVLLVLLWTPISLFLAFKPLSYTSTWSLILPGTGTGHAVSLESIGQASASVNSPYTSHSVDPKVNYKALVESQPVLQAAARRLDMHSAEFGQPRIKLVDQTALMHFRVTGASPQQALDKSNALYAAFQEELNRLRSDELQRREMAVSDMLAGYSNKLRDAQQRILDYQLGSEIVSVAQFDELTLGLERQRNRLTDLVAEQQGQRARLTRLTEALDTTPAQAAAVISLHDDPLIQELASAWSEAAAKLSGYQANLGNKHQKVVSARETEAALRKALRQRANDVAPRLESTHSRWLTQGDIEIVLFRELVELDSQIQGHQAQIESLQQTIDMQSALLERSTADASNLEDLKRKHQVATAVFSTALAKVDLGKSDRFSSYPLVQLLSAPTLPESADTLGRKLALLGGFAGSFFILFGLTLLWIRKPFFRKLLKNA